MGEVEVLDIANPFAHEGSDRPTVTEGSLPEKGS
jgi:hypothetical protein